MNLVWHVDGYSISSISMNRWNGMQMWTSGMAWFRYDDEYCPFQWEATVNNSGWYVVITKGTGKVGEYQGSTFNLPLEIVAAAKKLIGYHIPA